MPLQNRVTPYGDLVALPERGTMMGNRGILHDAEGRIVRGWASRAWITCLLEFRGRRGPVMAPSHYTRLFFLDEVTALAAGHRPCAECRRADYLRFRSHWAAANTDLGLGVEPRAADIDRVLHDERVLRARGGGERGGGRRSRKRTWPALLGDLPNGVLVALPQSAGTEGATAATNEGDAADPTTSPAWLYWDGRFVRWTSGGYADERDGPSDLLVDVLTPRSIVAAIHDGYQVMVHPSAARGPAPGR
ncbi:MAG: hypothetical protein IT305_02515 [Chloroflexi bacterium]|nr:hypothetical protein [Chloroflexota bacterium]